MSTTLLHYFRKTDIEFSRITGTNVPTLCGRTQPVLPAEANTSSNGQQVPICEECNQTYHRIPSRVEQEIRA